MKRRRTVGLSMGATLIWALSIALAPAAMGATRTPNLTSAYINGDTGLASQNADVTAGSNCATPDRRDTQQTSTLATTDRNVHVDACLFRSSDELALSNVNGTATFDSSGKGYISTCKDPDGKGIKRAYRRDRTGDGRVDQCVMTGYQNRGIAGDREFHIRVNHTGAAGIQTITFCYDSDRNGCSDESVKTRVTITWVKRAALASSYINPDTGTATANPDVAAASDCAASDQADVQQLSTTGTTNRNVHNDACLFVGSQVDTSTFDGRASFDSSGVGSISACPDPDGAGPKTATLTDQNGDGRMDLCRLTGYQSTGATGDGEYHARMNNTDTVGDQVVVFCYDNDRNGCTDETVTSRTTITWVNTPTRASSYFNPDTGAVTANANVDAASDCGNPDVEDTQQLSPAASTSRNVHNDACLFVSSANLDQDTSDFDGAAAFDSSGVGAISACPDPDGTGPKTATLTDQNSDGRMDLCRVTGYQATGLDGDGEYHARLNNSTTVGDQFVTFCWDRNANGCADELLVKKVVIHWIATAP